MLPSKHLLLLGDKTRQQNWGRPKQKHQNNYLINFSKLRSELKQSTQNLPPPPQIFPAADSQWLDFNVLSTSCLCLNVLHRVASGQIQKERRGNYGLG